MRPFSHLWKDQFQLLHTISAFICPVNSTSLVCKLYTFFWTILDLLAQLLFEVNYQWDMDQFSFNSQLPFQLFARIRKFHKLSLYVITYFKHGKYSIWGILLLEFIRSTKHKSNYHLLVLVIFPDLDRMKFWSVNYMWQICEFFSLSIFCKQWGSNFLTFVKYTYHRVIAILLENVFGTFWLETFVLWQKVIQNRFVCLFCPENGRAGSRKTSITC